jgi:hypothetical protein
VHILPFAQEKKEGRKALIFFHTKALKKNKKQTRIELPLRGRGYWITKEKDIFLFQNNKYKLIEKKKKSWVWWDTCIIPALRRLTRTMSFEANLATW